MNGVKQIQLERIRQIKSEGYTSERDDKETINALSNAAIVYAMDPCRRDDVSYLWPWSDEYFKPDTTGTIDGRIKELVKAGALIAAEIDKLERIKQRTNE